MSKLVKIAGRITGGLFEWILILLIFLAFAIRSTPIQTFLARQATRYLSKELKTTLRIDKVSIIFFHKVALDGVFVLDQQKDTLASINTVFVTLKSFSQAKNLVALDEVNLEGGLVKISRAKETGEYNYGFIQDYFSSDKPKKKKSKPIDVTLDNIRLTKVNVHYDDFRKDYSDFGMDFDHLYFKNVYLFASEFSTANGAISALIKQLSFQEKSGFDLDKFATYVNVSQQGLKLKALHIVTPLSKIYMPKMNLLMNEMADLQEFEDSVTFDVRINESSVSLKDISYFASALKGMDQEVVIEGDISNKVKNLRVAGLTLKTGDKTKIQGTINLPDFREFDQAFFQEKLSYVYIDLKDIQSIRMPDRMKDKYLSLGEIVNRLGYFKAIDLKVDGFYSQFVVESDKISTALGSVRIDHGIMFSENKKKNSFVFEQSRASDYDVKIDSFQLGKFIDQQILGTIHGTFFLNGEVGKDGINFNNVAGELTRADFMDYSYRNIHVVKASFIDNIFDGEIVIDDENLKLTYDGSIDVNKQQHFNFAVDIQEAQLNNLKIIRSDTMITLTTAFTADISGTNINNYSGRVSLDSLLYQSGRKAFEIPKMEIRLNRSPQNDRLSLQSRVLTASVDGKVDFNTIADDFNNQFSVILPALFKYKQPKKASFPSHFNYNITVQDINDLLFVFVPDLKVSPGTAISGSYNGNTDDFSMNLTSPFLKYAQFKATGVNVTQNFSDSSVSANYQLASFSMYDTLKVNQVSFITNGSKGNLRSELKWNPGTTNESYFAWDTYVQGLSSYKFDLSPSFFSINEHRWDIARAAHISFTPEDIHIDSFLMRRDNQYISLNGALSVDESESLRIKINDFELEDFSSLLGVSAGIKGKVNAEVTMSNPFDNLGFLGTTKVSGLYVNNQEVGDVNLSGNWNKAKESIELKGDLLYMKTKTFNFEGNYYLNRTKNSIDFALDFDRTNIQFANAFLDPKVVSNVKGLLEGRLHITGEPQNPVVEGNVELLGGNAKVQMFGVNFGFSGRINVTKDMIAINHMPIVDEEGNTAAVNGTILHNNFKDWNLDLFIDIDEDRSDDFLVLNTVYQEGSIYYGKAYVTGYASIEGYTDNLDITVNMKTERRSQINFPMYGVSELGDDLSFEWKKPDDTTATEPKIDFTGVNLDLNFTITPDAEIKVIFNDQTGDEITAHGRGQIGIKLNNVNDLSMDGTFTITDGKYNFVLPGLKKSFIIDNGGTITWNGGGAENAKLNIKTTYVAFANVNEIVQDLESQRSSASNQTVYCILYLTGTLSEPEIKFEIAAPKASETAKQVITGINNNPDELNRQFFSLLLANKFQTAAGGVGTAAGSNAAFEALTGQINGLLSELSKDVRLNVGLQRDEYTGSNSQTIGFTTNAFNDKLIISGNFGVENNAGGTNQSTLIGDLNLEYILDDNGNFRVSIFNESNDYTVIQDKNLGPFTQGVGLQYKESFQTYKDFRLLQTVLDLFRKRKNKVIKFTKKRKQTPVPPLNAPKQEIVKPEQTEEETGQ